MSPACRFNRAVPSKGCETHVPKGVPATIYRPGLPLQAARSRTAAAVAWLDALQKFPDSDLAARWKTRAPLTRSWQRKVAVLPPLTQTPGGLVIFTQFLATQQALADALAMHKVKTWVLNGQVPAADRQRIVESFQNQGGALLLTRSGTEGRNLQFCHRLVNFDSPWNPMEIEQRIGRLHRIGQQQIVEIYNLVQAGTLQAHLLGVLPDKLNLFDLVVGETGLILGERFSSEDFEEEVFRRWQHSSGDVATAFQALGEELRRGRVETTTCFPANSIFTTSAKQPPIIEGSKFFPAVR